MGSDIARFYQHDIPVVATEKIRLGAPIQITGFSDAAAKVAKSAAPTRIKCEKCGHEMVL